MTTGARSLKSSEEIQNIDTFASIQAVDEYSTLSDLFPIEARILDHVFPPAPARVLDLGCGAGRTTIHLQSRGYQVTAGDIVPAMIEKAKSRVPGVDFRVLDATRIDLASEQFDAVWFSFNGLDYIYPFSSRLSALREIKRVLKPGGMFVYSSHNIIGRCTRVSRPLVAYHLAFLYQSLGRPLLQNYWRERHYGDQWLTAYCGIPTRQVRTLQNVGFEFLGMESRYGETMPGITLKDYWPHYVARKRAL